jgi:hypothetical protein
MSSEAESVPPKDEENSRVSRRELGGRLLDAIFGEYETTSLPVDSRGVVDCTELALKNGGHGFQIFEQLVEHDRKSAAARLERRKRRAKERQQKASRPPTPQEPDRE